MLPLFFISAYDNDLELDLVCTISVSVSPVGELQDPPLFSHGPLSYSASIGPLLPSLSPKDFATNANQYYLDRHDISIDHGPLAIFLTSLLNYSIKPNLFIELVVHLESFDDCVN